jgi:hypothetical protein
MLLLKIIGVLIVIWLAFTLIGFVVKALGTLLIIAAVITVGAIGYAAIKNKSGQRQIGPKRN